MCGGLESEDLQRTRITKYIFKFMINNRILHNLIDTLSPVFYTLVSTFSSYAVLILLFRILFM